jgi:hypothetical protein
MAFWDIDLTTRAGAKGATDTGALACFVYAAASFGGLALSGALLSGGEMLRNGSLAIGIVVVAGIEIVVGVIAGLRLRSGKGAYWGIAAAAVIVLDIISHLVSLMGWVGLILCAVLLVLVVNGIRGALALKKGIGFDDDVYDTFN